MKGKAECNKDLPLVLTATIWKPITQCYYHSMIKCAVNDSQLAKMKTNIVMKFIG